MSCRVAVAEESGRGQGQQVTVNGGTLLSHPCFRDQPPQASRVVVGFQAVCVRR